jgi:hypothetical protein
MLLTESLIGGAIFTNQIFEFSFSWPISQQKRSHSILEQS